jgi:hypothetical protein
MMFDTSATYGWTDWRRVWLQHGRTQIDDCPVGVAFCSHSDEVLGVLGVSG